MLKSLRTCELSDDALQWYARYLTALASGNAAKIEPFLDKDCSFQFNNLLPLYGSATVAMGISRYLSGVESMQPEILNIYGSDRSFAVELLHHYVRKDGATITVPTAGFTDRNDVGLVTSVRFHIDPTPVFAETLR